MAGEWAGEMTRGEPVPFDTSVAHVARVYNYWLGGKDNFAADRAAGDQAIRAFPDIGLSARSDRKSTRLNSSHDQISYAVFCLKKQKKLAFSICFKIIKTNNINNKY